MRIVLGDGHRLFIEALAEALAQDGVTVAALATLAAITGLTPGASSAALPGMNSGDATIVRVTSAGNTVTLGTNNTVRGLTLGNSSGIALTGSSFGTLSVRDASILTSGSAISLTTGVLDVIVTKVSSASGTHGIALTATTGGLEVTGDGPSDPANTTRGRTTAKNGGGTLTLGSGGTITGASGAGVLLSNAANVTLRNMTITANGSGVNTGGIDWNAVEIVGEHVVHVEGAVQESNTVNARQRPVLQE